MRNLFIIIVFAFTIFSCKKEWLDEKSNKALIIPTSLQECQLILDNNSIMNLKDPAIGEMGSDNYFKHSNDLISHQEIEQNIYLWSDGDSWAERFAEWNYEYQKIFYANSVLAIVENIETTNSNETERNHIRGSALFFRGAAHFNLANLFSKQFNAATASTDPGIPLKLSADINVNPDRGTLMESYDRIITDLTEAIPLLPVHVDHTTRPSKAAAEALLSDVFLTMGDYDKALIHANAALMLQNDLLDFNYLDPAANSPFARFNEEVILHNTMISYGILSASRAYVDTNLYASYHDDDLRKLLYFTSRAGGYTFKGSYNQNVVYFSGLATDELYLIKAECLARTDKLPAAMEVLNSLLVTRWKTGTFVPFTAATKEEALTIILKERRKELIFRGRRWKDLRRLNLEPPFQVTLKRDLNGVQHTLLPNDKKYTYPIPLGEIRITGLTQNPR